MAQRRGRRIAMNPDEVDAFLAAERTCRVASVGPSGPHVTPLWFWWDGQAIWLYSLTRSQRWADIVRTPRVAIVIDAGHDYFELRGVELAGDAEVVGEAPRTASAEPRLLAVERAFARKYAGQDDLYLDGRHGWLRVPADELRSWDFRKINS
jgi:hypothetical protein